jgi:hypothetical protein
MNKKLGLTSAFLKAAEMDSNSQQLDKFKKIWWYNNRSREDGGLRLTEEGFKFVEEHCDLKNYKVDLPKELKFTPQVLLWLDKFINSPFYIDKNSIVVYNEKTAFELYMFSGDIRKMGAAKAMNKQLCQD